jgi:hypothetical protein
MEEDWSTRDIHTGSLLCVACFLPGWMFYFSHGAFLCTNGKARDYTQLHRSALELTTRRIKDGEVKTFSFRYSTPNPS